MNWQRALPGVIIGAVVLFALSRLRGGSGGQVYNALVPTSSYTPPDRDEARAQAFDTLAGVGLGQLKLNQAGAEATQAFNLAKERITASVDLARLNNDAAFNRLSAELADRQYDRALQEKALDQTYALGQAGQLGQSLPGILQSILGAIGRGNQQSQGRSPGGSSGGGLPQSPPLNPNAQQRPRAANWNLIQRAIDNYRNSAVVAGDYDLGYLAPWDLSPWDWTTGYGQQGFDYWGGYYGNSDFLEPVGSVSTSYELFSPLGWWSDWGFESENDLWDWYAIDPDYFL